MTAVPLFFYKFNEKEQQAAVAEIKRRKAEAAGESIAEDANLEIAEEGFAPDTFNFPNADMVGVPSTDSSVEPIEEPAEEPADEPSTPTDEE